LSSGILDVITIRGDTISVIDDAGRETHYHIGSAEGFKIISDLWLRSGWDNKHVYSFTWLGRPIIQLPEDMFRLQELIWSASPDVIVETGVAHGGSLMFYASLCSVRKRGRVIGIDIEIRRHNRDAIESHVLAPFIALVEGDSTDPRTVDIVRSSIGPGERVMVLLDSCHTREHVRRELELYSALVTPGCYMIAMDGIMQQVAGAPRTQPDWTWNNPQQAVRDFAAAHPEFVIEEPAFAFNEGSVRERVTYWPGGILRRVM
jgi:cephalosporin hydroxylase